LIKAESLARSSSARETSRERLSQEFSRSALAAPLASHSKKVSEFIYQVKIQQLIAATDEVYSIALI